jgi:hypothetical protein
MASFYNLTTGNFAGNCVPNAIPPTGQGYLDIDPIPGTNNPWWDGETWQAGEAPEEGELPPDIAGFRIAMITVESFNLWAENLPNSLRENLKLAAVVGNLDIVGVLLEQALTLNPPSEESMIEWQAVLDQYRIPITLPLD